MNKWILPLLLLPLTAGAETWVSLETCQPNWNPNPPEELVQGYRVHIESRDGTPATSIVYDVGNTTQTTCSTVGLSAQGRYDLYLTAYNVVGESGPSEIVPFVLVVSAPGTPGGVTPPTGVKIKVPAP